MVSLIAVTGPTASGKTALAIALAERLGGEILSCDSMQIYRGMDIGTAKATAEEQARVRHHLIDICAPDEPFSAADYAERAQAAAEEISSRGKVPILCGGTGLYLEALRTGRHGEPMANDPAYREELRSYAREYGNEALHEKLAAVDPEAALAIHPNNLPRVIRALEMYRLTGKTKTELDRAAQTENPAVSIAHFSLTFHDRELLYRRIDARVEMMMAAGLMEETRALLSSGTLRPGTTAYQAIGYKECIAAIEGDEDAAAATERLKLATRHYAKRQLTWFSAKPHIPLYADENGEMRPVKSLVDEILPQVPFLLKK